MIILIHGEDTYRSRRYLDGVVEQFKKKHDPAGAGVVLFDADEATPDDFASALCGGGLFSAKRLVVAKHALASAEFRSVLESVISEDAIAPDTSLIVYHAGGADKRISLIKKLAAGEWSREFSAPDQAVVAGVISETVRERGGSIEPRAQSLLAEIAGSDSWRARNESIKLLHIHSGAITETDVREHVHRPLSEDIWSFVDAISAGNRRASLAALERELAAGSEPLYLLTMLVRQLRLLVALSGALGDDAELARELKLNPFVVKKTRAQARSFSPVRLALLYRALAKLDNALKSGKGEPKLLFTVLVDSIVK